MKKKLLCVLLSAVLALGLLPPPVRAAAYPVDTVVDSGVTLRLTETGQDVRFTYPKTGTTVLILYRDDPGSAGLLGSLAQCGWAEDERLNVVAVDASGRSRKAVRQLLAESGAADVVDLSYYNDDGDQNRLGTLYASLLEKEPEPLAYACVLIVQTVSGCSCIRSFLKGVTSAGTVKRELGKWVEFPPDPVTEPVISAQPKSTAAAAGGTATFRVAAEGLELNYQWYTLSPRGGWIAATAQGSRTEALTVSATMALNGARYRCEVWNSAGRVTTDEASLTVKELVLESNANETDVYRIDALTLRDLEGRQLASIPRTRFRVTVPITKTAESSGATVVLGAYTPGGRFVFLMKATLKDDIVGQTSTFVFPVNNEKGTVSQLVVLPVASLENPTLRGEPVGFPAFE